MNKNALLEKLNEKRLTLDINNVDYDNVIRNNIDNCFGYEEFNELFGFEEYYRIRMSKLDNENVFVYAFNAPEIVIDGGKHFVKHSIDGSILSNPIIRELLNNGRILFFVSTGGKDVFGDWIEKEYKYYYFGELFIHHIDRDADNDGWDLFFSYEANKELWKDSKGLEVLRKKGKENITVSIVKKLIVNNNDENYIIAKKLKKSILHGLETVKKNVLDENKTVDFSLCDGLNDETVKKIINTDAYILLINEELFHKILDPFPEEPMEVYVKIDTEEDTKEDVKKGSKIDNNVLLVKNKNMQIIDNCFYGEDDYRSRGNSLDYIYKPYIYKIHLKEPHPEFEPDKWYKVPISFSKADGYTEAGGKVLLVASDAEEREFFIKWSKYQSVQNVLKNSNILSKGCVTKKIESNLFAPNLPEIVNYANSKLNSIFKDPLTIKIYRIGQANMIYGKNSNGNIAFDFGIPITENINNSGWNIDKYNYIGGFRPNVVFISHWHSDHFEGLYFLNERFWQDDSVIFVAPKVGNREKEYDLVKYLIKSDKLIQIDDRSEGLGVYSYKNIKMFLGKGKKNDKTELNSRGLLFQLNNTLLPGDCNMEYWPDEYGKDGNGNCIQYDFICIPHHGASGCINNKLESFISDDVCFYFCCGYNNLYEHPNKYVVSKLGGLKKVSGPRGGNRKIKKICTNIEKLSFDVKKRTKRINTDPIEFDD